MKENTSPAKSSRTETPDRKSRQRLAILVDSFLETEIDRADLISDPARVAHYRRLLEKNLWQQKIDPHDPNWNFNSDLSDIAIDNPGLYPAGEISRRNLEESIDTILYFHSLLKSFWDDFKKHLAAFQGVTRERDSIRSLSEAEKRLKGLNAHGMDMEGLGQSLFDEVHRGREYSQEIQSPVTLRINYTFETGKVRFFYGGIDAVRALVDLLKDMAIDYFKKCKDKTCGKWFVMTSKRRRDFCSHSCAARQIERDKRETDPNRFNEYHKEYYQSRKKKDQSIVTEER